MSNKMMKLGHSLSQDFFKLKGVLAHAPRKYKEAAGLAAGELFNTRDRYIISENTIYLVLRGLMNDPKFGQPIDRFDRSSYHNVMQFCVDLYQSEKWQIPVASPQAGDYWIAPGDIGILEHFIVASKPPMAGENGKTLQQFLIGDPYVDDTRTEPATLIPCLAAGFIPAWLFKSTLQPILDLQPLQKEHSDAVEQFKIHKVVKRMQVIEAKAAEPVSLPTAPSMVEVSV